ncbi:MAG TPA: MFS transporter [Solirubrobacterales bacterium]|nr:MFS transporter [Solirubrobacterales bacterium]
MFRQLGHPVTLAGARRTGRRGLPRRPLAAPPSRGRLGCAAWVPRGAAGASSSAYSLVAAATQILWLTFAPIDTSAAHHYGVSTDAIGWLAEIFPLLYVVLALPAGRLLDAGFRPALAGGAGLVALGGVLRLGGQTFAWAIAGQVAVAVAQPLILNAVGELAADYLPVEDRPAGIAVGAGAGFAGMLIALVLGRRSAVAATSSASSSSRRSSPSPPRRCSSGSCARPWSGCSSYGMAGCPGPPPDPGLPGYGRPVVARALIGGALHATAVPATTS